MTDGLTTGDCSIGGGTELVHCGWNATEGAWQALGGFTSIECQGLAAGETCTADGHTYTSNMGVAIPQPQGTEASLRASKFLASDGEQATAFGQTLQVANQWTWTFWVWMGNILASGQQRGLWTRTGGSNSIGQCYFEQASYGGTFASVNAIECWLWSSGGSEFKRHKWWVPVKANEWHFIGISFDGDAPGDPLRLMIDGVAWNQDFRIDTSDNDGTGSQAMTAHQIIIGDHSGTAKDFAIHQAALFDRVISPREFADMFHGSWGVDGSDFGAVHAWRFCQNGDTGTSDVLDLVGSVNFLNSVSTGTKTCRANMTTLPPSVPDIELTSGALIAHPTRGMAKGLSYVVGFGDSQMGESNWNQGGTNDSWPEWRTPLAHLRGGWVVQSQAFGGIYCGYKPYTPKPVSERLSDWLAAGANDALGWDRSKTTVLIRCGANDAADTVAPGDPVSISDSWTAITGMVDAVRAAGMTPLVVTPWPIRQSSAGCGNPPCDAATDARGVRLDGLVKYMREHAVSEGVPLCDVYSAIMRIGGTEDQYPPRATSDTALSPYWGSGDAVHQAFPDGLKFDGDFIQRYCLGDPGQFPPVN